MNITMITGRITHDLELKTANSGTELCNFSVAVDTRRKDKDGNKKTIFYKCVVFGKFAVFLTTYFHKGDGINIVGSMDTDKYVNKDGINITDWELIVDKLEFPHSKGKASSDGSGAAQSEPTVLAGTDKDLPF